MTTAIIFNVPRFIVSPFLESDRSRPRHGDADDIAPLADLFVVEPVNGFVFPRGAHAGVG
jgi:hypothetical protein